MVKRSVLIATLIALLLGSGGYFVWSTQRPRADTAETTGTCTFGASLLERPTQTTATAGSYVSSITVEPRISKVGDEVTVTMQVPESEPVWRWGGVGPGGAIWLAGGYGKVHLGGFPGQVISYSPTTVPNGAVQTTGAGGVSWVSTPNQAVGSVFDYPRDDLGNGAYPPSYRNTDGAILDPADRTWQNKDTGWMPGGTFTVTFRATGGYQTMDQQGQDDYVWSGRYGWLEVNGGAGGTLAYAQFAVLPAPLELELKPVGEAIPGLDDKAWYLYDEARLPRFAPTSVAGPRIAVTPRKQNGYKIKPVDSRYDSGYERGVLQNRRETLGIKGLQPGRQTIAIEAWNQDDCYRTANSTTGFGYRFDLDQEVPAITALADPARPIQMVINGGNSFPAFFAGKQAKLSIVDKKGKAVTAVEFSTDGVTWNGSSLTLPVDTTDFSHPVLVRPTGAFDPSQYAVTPEEAAPLPPPADTVSWLDRLIPRAHAGVSENIDPSVYQRVLHPLYLKVEVNNKIDWLPLKLGDVSKDISLSVDGSVAQHDLEQEATINLKITKKDTTDPVSNASVAVKILKKDDGSAAPRGLELKETSATTYTKPPEVVVTTDSNGVATLKTRAKDLSLEDAKTIPLVVRATLPDGSAAEVDLPIDYIELQGAAQRTTPEQRFTPVGLDTEPDPLPEVPDDEASASPTPENSASPQAGATTSNFLTKLLGLSHSQAAELTPAPITGRAVERVYPGDVFQYELTATVGRGLNELAVTQENRDLVEPNVTEDLPIEEAVRVYINGQPSQGAGFYEDFRSKILSFTFTVDDDREIKPGDEVRVVFPFRAKQPGDASPPSDESEPPLDDVRTFSLAGSYTLDSGKKIEVKPLEIEYIAKTFLNSKVSQVAHRDPESGALEAPVTYTADEPVFPGDRLYYEIEFRALEDFDPAGYTLWSEWTKYAEFGGFGDGFSAHTNVDEENRTIEWNLEQLMEGGLLRAGRLTYFVDLNAEIAGAAVDDEGNAPQVDIQASVNVYDDHELTALAAPQIITTPLWFEITGELKTYLDEPWPYVTVYTHPDAASFKIDENGAFSWVPFEERTHRSRARTDSNGKYAIRVPRAELGAREVEVAEGETRRQFSVKVEYLDDLLPEGINPHYDYWFVFEDNQQPIVVKSEVVEVADVRAQQIDFDFSEVDPSGLRIFGRELGDRALTKVALAGTVALRAASKGKNFMESSARDLTDNPSSPVLGELKIQGIIQTSPGWWSEGLARTTSLGHVITIGPKASDVTDFRFEAAFEALFYHEFGHHIHYIALWPDSSPSSYPSVEQLTNLSELGLPYLFQHDIGLYDPHRGIRHPSTHQSYKEGVADFVSVFFLRQFERSSSDDWSLPVYGENNPADFGGIGPPHRYVDFEDTQQILPIFAGYANNPQVVNRSANATPVVLTADTEENAIRNFLTILLHGETTIDSSAAWWVGTPEAVTTLNTPLLAGGDEAERFIRILGIAKTAVAHDSEGHPIVTFPILARAIASELDTVEPLLKLVGLFEDRDCDFTYDEQLVEKLGDSGSFCNFLLRGGGLSSITELDDRSRQSPTALLAPRPWRDELWSLSDPAGSAAGYLTVEEPGPTIQVTIPGADTHQVTITHTLPSGQVWQQNLSVSGTQELSLNLYAPVIRSLIRVTVTGSSDVLDLDSSHVWRGYLSETPIRVAARKTFILDGGNVSQAAPNPPAFIADEEPLLPGQCRIENDQVVECRDRDNQPLVDDQIPPEARQAATLPSEETPSPRPPADRVIMLPTIVADPATATVELTTASNDPAGAVASGAVGNVKAGDTLAVETTGFVAGEVVDVLIDGQAVATDQVITGEGATLLILVPEDLPDGQHEVVLRRITGQVAGAKFRTGTNQAILFIALGLLLAILGVIIGRHGRWISRRGVAGSLLVVGAGLIILGGSDRIGATFEPIPVTQAIGQVYLPPGIEANHAYKNPLYQRWNMTTDTAWGTIGLVTLIERLAGDWKTLHPDEVLVVSDMGLRSGGTFGSHEGDGHAQTRAADLWTWNPDTQVSRVRTDPDFIADYDPRYVREFTALLTCLTNDRGYAYDELVIFFAPDEGAQWARTHGINYAADHANHWHVEVTPQFQGPRVDSSACIERARTAGQRTD